jgi:DNA-binding Lrp family transcriptional regulator
MPREGTRGIKAEQLIEEALANTAHTTFDVATRTPPGYHFDDLVHETGLSKPAVSQALKRLIAGGEVFAYVEKGEYPKLRYILLKLPPELASPPEDRRGRKKEQRRLKPIVNQLAARADYVELQAKYRVHCQIQSAFIQQRAMLQVMTYGTSLIARSREVIFQKLSREIQGSEEHLEEAGWPVIRIPRVKIRQIVQELFDRGFIKTESCVVAFPSEKFGQLEIETDATKKRLDHMWKEASQKLSPRLAPVR